MRTPPGDTVKVASGVAAPSPGLVYIHDAAGELAVVDLASGVVVARAAVDAEPIAVDGPDLLAVRPPTATDPGSIVVLRLDGSGLENLLTAPAVDPESLGRVSAWFDRAECRGEFDGDTAVVVTDLHTRYRGGAAADAELLDEVDAVHRTTRVVDRTSGNTLDLRTERIDPARASMTNLDGSDRPPNAEVGAAADSGRDAPTVSTAPGAESVAVVGDHVVYRTVEHADGVDRHYLHGASRDGSGEPWSHLIDVVRLSPEPPLPP